MPTSSHASCSTATTADSAQSRMFDNRDVPGWNEPADFLSTWNRFIIHLTARVLMFAQSALIGEDNTVLVRFGPPRLGEVLR